MSEAGAQPGRRRVWKYLLWLALAGALVMAGVGWYSTTESFRTLVRERIGDLQHCKGLAAVLLIPSAPLLCEL